MNNRQLVEEIINSHSLKAQNSSYDRDVCVLAVMNARDVIMAIPDTVTDMNYLKAAVDQLDELLKHYNDSDGEFTNGCGVIGALRDDIGFELTR